MRNGRDIFVFCCFVFFFLLFSNSFFSFFFCLFSLFLRCYFSDVLITKKLTPDREEERKENKLSQFHCFSSELNKTKEMDPGVLFLCFFYVHLFWVWRAKYISVYGFYTVFIYLLFIFEVILSALDVDIEDVLSSSLFFPLFQYISDLSGSNFTEE